MYCLPRPLPYEKREQRRHVHHRRHCEVDDGARETAGLVGDVAPDGERHDAHQPDEDPRQREARHDRARVLSRQPPHHPEDARLQHGHAQPCQIRGYLPIKVTQAMAMA